MAISNNEHITKIAKLSPRKFPNIIQNRKNICMWKLWRIQYNTHIIKQIKRSSCKSLDKISGLEICWSQNTTCRIIYYLACYINDAIQARYQKKVKYMGTTMNKTHPHFWKTGSTPPNHPKPYTIQHYHEEISDHHATAQRSAEMKWPAWFKTLPGIALQAKPPIHESPNKELL